jgi:glycosyltransferase involved in cell wall biosynthesis
MVSGSEMKIVIVVRILWTAGAPKIAIQEAKELKRLGHDVTLVFLRRARTLGGYSDLLNDIDWKVLSDGHNSFFTPLYDYITGLFMPDRRGEGRIDYDLLRKFPSFANEVGADYVICHDQWAGLAGYYTFRKYGIKYAVFLHERLSSFEVPILGRLAQLYEMKVLKNAIRVFAITEKVKKSAVETYGINPITNIPGIPNNVTNPFDRRKNVLLSVSMWDNGRHPHTYLKVAQEIQDFKLLIAGNWRDSELKSKMREEVRQMHLEDKVSFTDHLTEAQLSGLYRESKFLMRFGYGEYGLGTATLEAISFGLPLIVNSELGTAELIKEHKAGLVLDAETPQDVDMRKIVSFLENNNNIECYSAMQKGCEEIVSKYTWEKHCRNLLNG